MNKIFFYIFSVLLFICAPLIHTKFFWYFWIENLWNIAGNFEFTKVIFFEIIASCYIIFHIFSWRKILFSKTSLLLIAFLFLNSLLQAIFGESFFTHILWNNEKWHGVIMFLLLIILSGVFASYSKKEQQDTILIIIIWSIFVYILSIKELFIPSFHYGDLWNRAFWSFWHPNYLALYSIIILGILFTKKLKNTWKYDSLIIAAVFLSFIALILTKSVTAITLFLWYLSFRAYSHYKDILWKKDIMILICLFFISFISILYYFYVFWLSVKFNSFISRFFIWDSTYHLIISNWKTLLLWWWFDSLWYIFDKYKSPYLYIFENIWYTADRPHNFILYIFYSLWLTGLLLLTYIFYKFIICNKKHKYYHVFIISWLFLMLNFSSISSYIILCFLVTIQQQRKYTYTINIQTYFTSFLISILCIWIIIMGSLYYYEEYKLSNNNIYFTKNWIINNLRTENREKHIFYTSQNSRSLCNTLIKYINSVENYFYCGQIISQIDKYNSQRYYILWLNKIPDMRNKESEYFQNIFVKYLFSQERFFSEKYSHLKEILEITWKANQNQ